MAKLQNGKLTILLILIISSSITGCATHIPKSIKQAPPEDLNLARIQANPEQLKGKPVRWGGNIIATANGPQLTEIIILARSLDSYGEPRETDKSQGRFIAKYHGFLDPAVYAPGRAITIYGKFTQMFSRKVDSFNYRYPIIQVEQFYLWPEVDRHDFKDDPFWYDPWYPLWGPYYHPHRHY